MMVDISLYCGKGGLFRRYLAVFWREIVGIWVDDGWNFVGGG
jgi:hypothetical protein